MISVIMSESYLRNVYVEVSHPRQLIYFLKWICTPLAKLFSKKSFTFHYHHPGLTLLRFLVRKLISLVLSIVCCVSKVVSYGKIKGLLSRNLDSAASIEGEFLEHASSHWPWADCIRPGLAWSDPNHVLFDHGIKTSGNVQSKPFCVINPNSLRMEY